MEKKPAKVPLDTFALGRNKETIHVITVEITEGGVGQRAWCGAPLDSYNLPWSAEIVAEQIKNEGKRLCKRCANGNSKAKILIDEAMNR